MRRTLSLLYSSIASYEPVETRLWSRQSPRWSCSFGRYGLPLKAPSTCTTSLIHTPNLTLLPVDLHVAQEAASLRATHNFKTPDALVIATGIVGQVGHLVTNDAEWKKKLAPMGSRIQVAQLGTYV